MRKFLVLLSVVAAIALMGDFATAQQPDDGVEGSAGTIAEYQAWGSIGELTLMGEPGLPFGVFDSHGLPVAQGVMDAPFVAMLVGNSGPAPDGVILTVSVGPEIIHLQVDPDWQWE